MRVIFKKEDNQLPIKIWADYMEDGAKEQANNLAKLPFAFKHIAIMPDVHQGYGMPIGGVMATKDYVVPNAVGVDIGCGMRAVKTNIYLGHSKFSENNIKKVMQGIREKIPVGFSHNKDSHYDAMPVTDSLSISKEFPVVSKEYDSACFQIGTLGGGNHFIEIQRGKDNYIWIMVHSGSRNLGYKVARYYNDEAKRINKLWKSEVPPSWDLAFLPFDSDMGKGYLDEMNYCIKFAEANRGLMMSKIKEIMNGELGETEFEDDIDVAHNYVRLENHFGQNVWVHRKGATSARLGEIGIIPGSQGTKSYIVEGLGNEESFESCSHGAGRMMSRSKAKEKLDLEEQKKILDSQGIIHGIRNITDLDEAPGAYKDILTVMEQQKDLIKIIEELTPIAVIKG